MIWDNPSILGLGDLETVTKEKVVSSGGKIDSLMEDSLDDTMYEVEVSLGDTGQANVMQIKEVMGNTRFMIYSVSPSMARQKER
jgi:hypothetical protein